MLNKSLLITLGIVIIACLVFIGLWRINATELKQVKGNLEIAQNVIESLMIDKSNLMEYITTKETELKDIQNKYEDRLKNIPADKCGDAKPSKELLDYLKERK